MHNKDYIDKSNNDQDNNHIVWVGNSQWHAHIHVDSIFTTSL